MHIIGITGTLGAGKGTIVEYLIQKYGFQHCSVRAFLIKEIEKRNMPVNRDSMVIVANDLRTQYGPSYIVEQLYEEAKLTNKNTIIESIRAVGEAEALKKKWTFSLFAIDADQKIRYERNKLRNSETDQISYQEFINNEEREMKNTDPNKQNLANCIELADFKIENNGTKEELHSKIDEIIKKI